MRVLLIIFFFLYQMSCYANWQDLWFRKDQQAMHLLNKGKAAEAAKTFESRDWQAVANYKAKQYSDAENLYKQNDNATANYNLGNSLALQGKYEEAISSYDEALKKQPNMPDAVYNRDLVKKLLEQQKKEEQKDKQQDKKEQKKEDKKNQDDKKDQNDKQQKKNDDNKDQQKTSPQNQSKDEDKNKPNQQIPQDNGNNEGNNQGNHNQGQDKNTPQDKDNGQKNSQSKDSKPGNQNQSDLSQGKGSSGNDQNAQSQMSPNSNLNNGQQQKDQQQPQQPNSQDPNQLAPQQNNKPGKQENSNAMLNNRPFNETMQGNEQQDKEGGYAAKRKQLDDETDQWLQQIPDDPGGLLRRKIMRDHIKKMNQAESD